MPTIAIRLDPTKLDNPDLDIRYVLPDRLASESDGLLRDDGYDYAGHRPPYLILYQLAADATVGLNRVIRLIQSERILGNDLRPAAVVALREPDGRYRVEYPPDFTGSFPI
jgi:hypothetical protein